MSSSLISSPSPLPDALSDPIELLPFAKVKLIAFDVDGTLISRPEQEFGPRLAKLFSLVSSTSVRLTLATGRTLSGLSRKIEAVEKLTKIPLILYNGSVVMQPSEKALIALREIPNAALTQIRGLSMAQGGVPTFVYAIDSAAGLIGGATSVENVFFFGGETRPDFEFNGMPVQPISAFRPGELSVVAILMELPLGVDREAARLSLLGIAGVSVTASGGRFLEIRPEGASKADGLAGLAKRLSIDPVNILAVGDNDNDVELLEWAGISVCVSGASQAAQRASKFVSMHGPGSAAIEVLELVRRAQRLFKDGRRSGRS